MYKIKFRLIVDEKPCRKIEQLQENFCIQGVLEHYESGLLQKWLDVREFNDHLKKVQSIQSKKKEDIIKQLIEIFEIEKDEKEIQEAISILNFEEQRKNFKDQRRDFQDQRKKIIDDYHQGYKDLKTKIKENKEDMPFMKTATREIVKNYFQLFQIDYVSFFHRFKIEVPLMIYAVLMNEKLRSFFLEKQNIKNEIVRLGYGINKIIGFSQGNNNLWDSFEEYKTVKQDEKQMIREKIQKKIGWKSFDGDTDGY